LSLRLLPLSYCLGICLTLADPGLSFSQQTRVSGQIVLTNSSAVRNPDSSGGVVWLTPLAETRDRVPSADPQRQQLVQHHKSFSPHLLVVQAGSQVEFPNHDPFFHNVFSLFEGKRFDLGLYQAGSTRALAFDRTGICYIFCNIHSEMSAVILVLSTPYYAISDRKGEIDIPNVVPGLYELHVWHERAAPKVLNGLTRKVTIAGTAVSFGVLRVAEQPSALAAHKNKYGQDYQPPSPDSPLYAHP